MLGSLSSRGKRNGVQSDGERNKGEGSVTYYGPAGSGVPENHKNYREQQLFMWGWLWGVAFWGKGKSLETFKLCYVLFHGHRF